MHTIHSDNYHEAEAAIGDILRMYVDLVENGGFNHSVENAIRFSPDRYVDAELEGGGWVDLAFLQEGCAMAILATMYSCWLEHDTVAGMLSPRYVDVILSGRLEPWPDIDAVAREALQRRDMAPPNEWFAAAAAPIYNERVRGYFERLLRIGGWP